MTPLKTSYKLIIILIAVLGLGLFASYTTKNTANANDSGADGQAPQAMPVTVEAVKRTNIQIWKNYSARLEAVEQADIKPQVSGTITEIRFKDGQAVEKGDILYVIDPRPFEATVNQAKAELNAAKNQSSLAQKQLKRARELVKTDAVSKRLLDERLSTANVARATIESARAKLERAEIDLDYARVKAPISGRLSRAEIKEGNLVEAGSNAPILTSIVSLENVYADFEVDEQTYLTYIRSSAKDLESENQIPVKLTLSGDQKTYNGFIDSFDNKIDVSSGTIRARALFTNEDGALLPGMFANVKIGSSSNQSGILITERAIGTDQDRKFVYVVNDQNMVEYREIKIGESIDGQRVVTSGLKPQDRVITEGIIRIRPGMPVSPQLKTAENMAKPKIEQ